MPYANKSDRAAYDRARYERDGARHATTIRPPLPRFIAVDGEGVTPAGSDEHIYTLLAASSGASVENWRDGLATEACFEFLLSQAHAGRTLVAFAFTYDMNMILRDLPEQALKALWESGETLWRGAQNWYKLEWAPTKFFHLHEVTVTRYQDKETGAWKLSTRARRSVKVWDVWGFFQGKFTSALKDWLPEDAETIDYIAEMKEQRDSFDHVDPDRIRAYCFKECELLVRVMSNLARALWKAELYLSSWHGAGAIAAKLLKTHEIKRTLAYDEWPEEVKEACLWAYFGGRVECFRQGVMPGSLYDYDIRSAYPSAMLDLPELAGGRWIHTTEYDPEWPYALWYVHWNVSGEHEWLAPFPQRYNQQSIYWLPQGRGWYHASETRAAWLRYGDALIVGDGWVFIPETTEKPFTWIRSLYNVRAAYKAADDPRHFPLKVGLNSLYGKLAQSAVREDYAPPFQNYYLAGFVTAATRARMLEALWLAGPQHAVMAATDGCFSLTELPLDLSETLGGWEVSEIAPETVVMQAGVWFEPGEDGGVSRVRTRGFGARSLAYEQVRAAWETRGSGAEIPYSERRFIGLGYAMNTGNMSLWRRWLETSRSVSFDVAPAKRPEPVPFGEKPTGRLLPGYALGERTPYAPKNTLDMSVFQEWIDLLSQQEQPEGAGND